MRTPDSGLATEPSDLDYAPDWAPRAMAPEEHAALSAYLDAPSRRSGSASPMTAWASVVVLVVLGGFAYLGLQSIGFTRLGVQVGLLSLFIAGILVFRALRLHDDADRSGRAQREALRTELAEGQVEVALFDVFAAVRAEDPRHPDEPGYFLQIAEEHLLFLETNPLIAGPLRDLVARRRFPSTEVLVARTPRLNAIVGLRVQGEPLPVLRTRAVLAEAEYWPEGGEILSGRLETLDRHLREWGKDRA